VGGDHQPTFHAGERFLDLALAALAVHPDPELHRQQLATLHHLLLLPMAAIAATQEATELPHGGSNESEQEPEGRAGRFAGKLSRELWEMVKKP
jgi:hypothetical protein